MSRSLTTIYNEAVTARNEYLGLKEINNTSKMSIINTFTWVTSAAIYSFENIMDVFLSDVANLISNKINGTSSYYVNALLKYQDGDELVINKEGTGFSYSSVDEEKRIITKAAYKEIANEEFNTLLLLKVATGEDGALTNLSDEQLIRANNYIDKIKFAGTRTKVISLHGDVLVPKLTVFYDGAVSQTELSNNIHKAIETYIHNLPFNSQVYVTKIIDCIQTVQHVSDVYIDNENGQGIFLAQYKDNFICDLIKIDRISDTVSGYLCESSKSGVEADIPIWNESIELKIEV